MKLTNKTRHELRGVLRNMERAQAYIMADHIAVCRRSDMATTTVDYSRPDGKALSEVQREYGSDLCGLSTAIDHLAHFIATH